MHRACLYIGGGLTRAGKEVPAAEQIVGGGSQQILGTAQSPKTKITDVGGRKKKVLFV